MQVLHYLLLFGIIPALAACGDAPVAPVPSSAPEAPATGAFAEPTARPAPVTLAGEWKVVAIDGQDFNESYGLSLSASDTEIWWEPRCAGSVRSYAIAGNRLTVKPASGSNPSPRPGDPPPPVCAIGVPERLGEVVRALDAAATIERTPSNGIEIAGGGHSLLLLSQ